MPLFAGVSLPLQGTQVPTESESVLEASLPRDWSHKNEEKLDQMIYDSLTSFLANRTLIMNFSRQAVQEGTTGFMWH
jgi:hypothetical protein